MSGGAHREGGSRSQHNKPARPHAAGQVSHVPAQHVSHGAKQPYALMRHQRADEHGWSSKLGERPSKPQRLAQLA